MFNHMYMLPDSLAFNSFRWRAIRLFNAVPKYLMCTIACSVVCFKTPVDYYLKNIGDHPCIPEFKNSRMLVIASQWWSRRDDLVAK